MRNPWPSASSVTAASVVSSVGVKPPACSPNASAMVKQPACAAAINSSGLVPFSFSKRVLKEYGVAASTPESVERLPLPSRPVPRHTAFALRIMLHLLAVATSHLKLRPHRLSHALQLESDLAYAGLSRGAPRIARWYSASNTGSSIDP